MRRSFISFKGLQGKFLIWLLLLGLIPQLTVSALAFWNSSRTVREKISDELVVAAYESADKVDRKLAVPYNEIQLWSQLDMFSGGIRFASYGRMDEVLKKVVELSNNYHALIVFDRNGDPLVAAQHSPEGMEHSISTESVSNRSEEEWFRAIIEDEKLIHIGNLVRSDITNNLTIPFSSPIKDSSGSIIGVLVGFYNWEEVKDTIDEELTITQKGALALINNDGLVLYDTAIEEATLNANLLEMQPLVKEAIRGGSTKGLIIEQHLDIDSAIGYAASDGHSSYPGVGWSVLAIVPSAEAFRPLVDLGRIILVAAIVAAIVNILISGFISRSVANPLTRMVDVADKIASGDFRQTVSNRNNRDEVGQLGSAFNSIVSGMTGALGSIMRSSDKVTTTSQNLSALSSKTKENAGIIVENIKTIGEDAKTSSQTVERATASIEEMSSSAQLIAGKSQSASESSQEATKIALQGGKIVDNAIATMNSIKEAVGLSSSVIEELSDASKQIGDIVIAIKGIADQTNLLALNAAIEAARAGDQGRGFAVVAEEVRKLAEQSSKATEEISNLILGIQDKTVSAVQAMTTGTHEVEDGVKVVNEVGNSLGEIVRAVDKVSEMMEDISASVQEQSSNTEEMAGSIEEVAQITERSLGGTDRISEIVGRQVDMFNQIASSADTLRSMSQELENSVSQFKLTSTKDPVEESNKLMQIEDLDHIEGLNKE